MDREDRILWKCERCGKDLSYMDTFKIKINNNKNKKLCISCNQELNRLIRDIKRRFFKN